MTKAFISLTAERLKVGPLKEVAGALQQETRLFQGGECVCVLLVTYPAGSPEWMKWAAARTLDSSRGAPVCGHHPV
ncbi:hypothetical protein [Aquabacterium sp.]|uniref:hypothetical protein n=1 Tax=Aquabacterium sp. TaxID=1872578 RepID=UPI0025C60AFC|nr:hypothetical protein [Aquabacterium sp.]